MNNKTNKDLPAFPVMPVQDQFGQVIVFSGFSKHEAVALEVFKLLMKTIDVQYADDLNHVIKQSYEIAELFVKHFDKLQQGDSIMMPV